MALIPLPFFLAQVDFSGVDSALGKIGRSGGVNFSNLVGQVLSGEMSLSPVNLLETIGQSLLWEVGSLLGLMRNMLVIAIFSAFFKTLSGNFSQKSVVEVGFYANFMVVMTLLFTSFTICTGILHSLANDLYLFMEALIPVLLALMAASGNLYSATSVGGLTVFILGVLTRFVGTILGPVICLSAVLHSVNCIFEKDILTKLSDLVKKTVSWGLKTAAAVFLGILAITGLSAPAADNALTKPAKSALAFVPGVGSALGAAVDSIYTMTQSLKSGVMVTGDVSLILICSVPIIKIAAFILVYKLTAGLIQPICDERIVDCIDGMGDFAGLVLGAAVLMSFIFIVMVIITMAI